MLTPLRKWSVELPSSSRLFGKIFDSCKAYEDRSEHQCRQLFTIFDLQGNRASTDKAFNDISSWLYWMNRDSSIDSFSSQCFSIIKDLNAYSMSVTDLNSSEEEPDEVGQERPMQVPVHDHRNLRASSSKWIFQTFYIGAFLFSIIAVFFIFPHKLRCLWTTSNWNIMAYSSPKICEFLSSYIVLIHIWWIRCGAIHAVHRVQDSCARYKIHMWEKTIFP